ncbi:MAG: DUF2997 domain-containing protein [Pirellulales bacterium]
MKTIHLTVSPKGKTHLETTGFSGSDCREASRFLEQALGTTASEQLTSEFHQTQHQHHKTHLEQEHDRY